MNDEITLRKSQKIMIPVLTIVAMLVWMTPWRQHGLVAVLMLIPAVWSVKNLIHQLSQAEGKRIGMSRDHWLIIGRDAAALGLTSVLAALGSCWAIYTSFQGAVDDELAQLADQMGQFVILSFRDLLSVVVSLMVLWITFSCL